MKMLPKVDVPGGESNRSGVVKQFDHMGEGYIRSMRDHPEVRHEEWLMIESRLGRDRGPFLDYACGEGYVSAHLLFRNPEVRVVGVDSSATMLSAYRERFRHDARVSGMSVEEFENASDLAFGVAICLGGFHHVMDQVGTTRRIRDCLEERGRFLIADFADESPSQAYFDELIDKFNPTGHVGLFLSKSRACNLARATGLRLVEYDRVAVGWRFDEEQAVFQFVVQHHGLSCSPAIVGDFLRSKGMIEQRERSWILNHVYSLVEYAAE